MWSDESVGADEELRQGDLLKGVLLPKLSLPLRFIIAPGKEPQPNDDAVIKVQSRDMLVVSQCCEIENSDIVALAPIASTGSLDEDGARPYLTDEPSEDEPYVYAAFRLVPTAHLTEDKGRLKFADLTAITSYRGKNELRPLRIARMTPEGRRILRRKLMFFWGRAAADDERWLADQASA